MLRFFWGFKKQFE